MAVDTARSLAPAQDAEQSNPHVVYSVYSYASIVYVVGGPQRVAVVPVIVEGAGATQPTGAVAVQQ